MHATGPLDFSPYDTAALRRMTAAGAELAAIEAETVRTGIAPLFDFLPRGVAPTVWDHYPPGDVWDPVSHFQYYYHCHPMDERLPGEHGHLHLFYRPDRAPTLWRAPGLSHLHGQAAPELTSTEDPVCHLVALSLDPLGQPLTLFTTNAWVTGETWIQTNELLRAVAAFRIEGDQPSARFNLWLTALVTLHRPWINHLLRRRDERVLRAARLPGRQVPVLEDRAQAVLSSLQVDSAAAWAQVRAALRARGEHEIQNEG